MHNALCNVVYALLTLTFVTIDFNNDLLPVQG